MSPATNTTLLQRTAILWWKWRYGWRIYTKSKAHADWLGSYLPWCVGECATAGWEYAFESNGKSLKAALLENPIDWADDELSCWTD